MNEYLEKISIDEAIEVAKKYAEDISMFASVDKYAVSKVCQMLLQQLQAYKDKEYKLKKLCNDDYFNENYTGDFIEELLQILNEGSDGNE